MRGQATLFAGAHRESNRATGSTDNWGTPQAFFDLLNSEFSFTLDPCADESNAKCAYFDVSDDGLSQDWGNNICFVNPPYSNMKAFAAKCIDAARKGATVVVLCAARTDTGWWQMLVRHASEVRFVLGRLAFVGGNGKGQSATFPSSVIIIHPFDVDKLGQATLTLWEVGPEVRR